VSELPPGWALTTLGDIVTEVRNGISAKPDRDDGLPILRISAVRPMKLDIEDIRYLPYNFQGADTNRLVEGDLLFTRYNGNRDLVGVCARVRRLSRDTVYPDKLIRVRVDRTVANAAFVERAVHVPEARDFIADKLKTSAGQVGISGADLKRLPIPLAPLPEQKRIADKLDALLLRVDACRERLDRVPGILKRFRQAVLAAATSGELTREWREEWGIPSKWRVATLGSLLIDVRYGTSKKCAYEPSKTPVLRIPNVAGGTVNHDDMKYADFDEDEMAKLALAPGDLLMIRSNGSVGLVGRTALVSEREAGFLYAGYLIRLRSNAAHVSPAYLSLFLASPASRARIELTARSTTGVNNINAEEIRAFPVALPSLDEQHEVARRVGELFAMADRLSGRVLSAQAIVERTTPSALAKAFRGELVPQNPDDEPASTLLARLRTRADPTGNTGKPKRGGARGPRTNAKADTNMLTRKDVTPTHLTTILKERGALTAEALWTASQLEIDDFYDQLKDEEARGLLRENRGDSPTALRVLKAAA
jgi:type I restriction enzyme, S subunit